MDMESVALKIGECTNIYGDVCLDEVQAILTRFRASVMEECETRTVKCPHCGKIYYNSQEAFEGTIREVCGRVAQKWLDENFSDIVNGKRLPSTFGELLIDAIRSQIPRVREKKL